jgi:EAL domain-containing protein (putative c-di-GMP-specific phosphodiesterase class I)
LIRVITAQREAVEKLQQRSRLDSATGAPNRAGLTAHIEQLLQLSQRRNETEEAETAHLLAQWGIDYAQGNFLARRNSPRRLQLRLPPNLAKRQAFLASPSRRSRISSSCRFK